MQFATMTSHATKALRYRRGAAMVEYALLAGLIAVTATAGLRGLGQTISTGAGYLAFIIQQAGH